LFGRVDLVNIFPAAPAEGFEKSRETDVVENLLPVQRVDQVAHGLIGGPRRMLLVRQEHGPRNRYANFRRQRVVEELVVGAPPEWIVDDARAAQRGVLQVRAIERNVVRDSVDDDRIPAWLGHLDAADMDVLREYVLYVPRVDAVHQGARERVFHSVDDSDFWHGLYQTSSQAEAYATDTLLASLLARYKRPCLRAGMNPTVFAIASPLTG